MSFKKWITPFLLLSLVSNAWGKFSKEQLATISPLDRFLSSLEGHLTKTIEPRIAAWKTARVTHWVPSFNALVDHYRNIYSPQAAQLIKANQGRMLEFTDHSTTFFKEYLESVLRDAQIEIEPTPELIADFMAALGKSTNIENHFRLEYGNIALVGTDHGDQVMIKGSVPNSASSVAGYLTRDTRDDPAFFAEFGKLLGQEQRKQLEVFFSQLPPGTTTLEIYNEVVARAVNLENLRFILNKAIELAGNDVANIKALVPMIGEAYLGGPRSFYEGEFKQAILEARRQLEQKYWTLVNGALQNTTHILSPDEILSMDARFLTQDQRSTLRYEALRAVEKSTSDASSKAAKALQILLSGPYSTLELTMFLEHNPDINLIYDLFEKVTPSTEGALPFIDALNLVLEKRYRTNLHEFLELTKRIRERMDPKGMHNLSDFNKGLSSLLASHWTPLLENTETLKVSDLRAARDLFLKDQTAERENFDEKVIDRLIKLGSKKQFRAYVDAYPPISENLLARALTEKGWHARWWGARAMNQCQKVLKGIFAYDEYD